MFKLCLFALLCTLSYAARGGAQGGAPGGPPAWAPSGGSDELSAEDICQSMERHPDEHPYNIADFNETMKSIQAEWPEAAGWIDETSQELGQAIMSGQYEDFNNKAMDTIKRVMDKFGETEQRIQKEIERFWHHPGDFKENEICDKTASLDDSATDAQRQVAILSDLECFGDWFKYAENIPTHEVTADFKETDALEWFGFGLNYAHQLKHAGARFVKAFLNCDSLMTAASNEKRELMDLLQRLEKFTNKKAKRTLDME